MEMIGRDRHIQVLARERESRPLRSTGLKSLHLDTQAVWSCYITGFRPVDRVPNGFHLISGRLELIEQLLAVPQRKAGVIDGSALVAVISSCRLALRHKDQNPRHLDHFNAVDL